MAENIAKYCKKGRPLMVEGRLTFDQWEAQDGSKRSKHRVTVETFTFVDSGRSGDGYQGGGSDSQQVPSDSAAPPVANDDIPF
jgi:single-strand DNA-binding protein